MNLTVMLVVIFLQADVRGPEDARLVIDPIKSYVRSFPTLAQCTTEAERLRKDGLGIVSCLPIREPR